MKKADYPKLRDEVLTILPVHQKDAWKIMRISHQDISDVVKLMIDEKLIKRTVVSKNKQRTYLIELLNTKTTKSLHTKIIESRIHKKKILLPKAQKQKKRDFSFLLVNGLFSPCAGCISVSDCSPITCDNLTNWVLAQEKD